MVKSAAAKPDELFLRKYAGQLRMFAIRFLYRMIDELVTKALIKHHEGSTIRWIGMVGYCLFLLAAQCTDRPAPVAERIRDTLALQQGDFAVAFKDLQTGREILFHEHEKFHAASTMKTPVMVEMYRQALEGRFSLKDSLTVHNEFKSIADGSTYQLSAGSDSDTTLYTFIGKKVSLYDLMYRMIIRSSNLATNLVIEKVDAKQVTAEMRRMGLQDLEVLRGVEDGKAFEKGMNNTVTAYDLMLLFEQIARGSAVSPEASEAMTRILLDQEFNEIIPALLLAGVKVAHKTGSITALHHDSGFVILPDGRRYVLVLLSKNLKDEKSAMAAMARVSRMLYDEVTAP